MLELQVSVFGPADGLRALRLPDCAEIDHSPIALSEFDFEVSEGGRIIWVQTTQDPAGGTRLNIISAQQIYEPNLRRLGHLCGTWLEFRGAVPSAQKLITVTDGLLAWLINHCTSNGSFLGFGDFRERVHGLSREVYEHLPGLLGESFGPPQVAAPAMTSGEFYVRIPSDAQWTFSIPYIDWFFRGIGSLSANRVFVIDGQSGTLASRIKQLADTVLLDSATFTRIVTQKNSRIDELLPLVDACDRYRTEYSELSERFKACSSQFEILQRDYSALREQLSAIKRRGTDDPRNLAPVKIDARGALPPGRQPHPRDQQVPPIESSGIGRAVIEELTSIRSQNRKVADSLGASLSGLSDDVKKLRRGLEKGPGSLLLGSAVIFLLFMVLGLEIWQLVKSSRPPSETRQAVEIRVPDANLGGNVNNSQGSSGIPSGDRGSSPEASDRGTEPPAPHTRAAKDPSK